MKRSSLLASVCAVCFMTTVVASAADDVKPEGKRERKAPAAMLEKFDKNKNGVLDPEEREAAKKARETARPNRDAAARPNKEEMLKKFDKNGDGKLDEAERAAAREDMKKNAPRREGRKAAAKPADEKKTEAK